MQADLATDRANGTAADAGPDPDKGTSSWNRLPAPARAASVRAIRDKILEQRSGPLRPFHEDPVVRAILLLLGGAGAITTGQFLFLTGGY